MPRPQRRVRLARDPRPPRARPEAVPHEHRRAPAPDLREDRPPGGARGGAERVLDGLVGGRDLGAQVDEGPRRARTPPHDAAAPVPRHVHEEAVPAAADRREDAAAESGHGGAGREREREGRERDGRPRERWERGERRGGRGRGLVVGRVEPGARRSRTPAAGEGGRGEECAEQERGGTGHGGLLGGRRGSPGAGRGRAGAGNPQCPPPPPPAVVLPRRFSPERVKALPAPGCRPRRAARG
ncbi:hypothetical protein STTU_3992 [Streptomyces sp. Tu6071]|nr:hypothetical protein STTU_3992 [Streptomyces sp. Tu6071]